jgi:hypothetical protein
MAMADNHQTDKSEHTDRGQSRPAVVIAALLYLVTAYQRTPCPCVALCIVRHLECLTWGSPRAAAAPVRMSCACTPATPGIRFRSAPAISPP